MLAIWYFVSTIVKSRTVWCLAIGLTVGVAAERLGVTSNLGPSPDITPKVVRVQP
ncbi:MAG: hypothetical protein AAGC95_03260 [Pseudomonadota bacterium]